MTTLFATDLDGTLLGPDARLSKYTAQMLQTLIAEGELISFITARTPATIEPILQPAMPCIPGVAMTGATLWNPTTRLYESVTYHRPDDVTIIADICRQVDITPFVYTLPRGSNVITVYHEAKTLLDIERSFVNDRTISDLKTFKLAQTFPTQACEYTVLFFAMGSPAKISTAANLIREATGCYASCYPDTYHPGLALLEVFAPGVSKANGLKALQKLLGADRTIAFGDNLNDIPMLQAADVAIAVDNAHSEVKRAADLIIGPNTADSVVEFIAEWHENGNEIMEHIVENRNNRALTEENDEGNDAANPESDWDVLK